MVGDTVQLFGAANGRGFWWPPIEHNHTTTNQKRAGAGEERVEKRDECGGVAEGCQCATPACRR